MSHSLSQRRATERAAKQAEQQRRAEAAMRRAEAAMRRAPSGPHGRAMLQPLGPIAFSPDTRRALELRDRQAIDAVLSGSGTRQDLASVECITICQRRLLQSAVDAPAAHQVDVDSLRAMLALIDAEIVPAVWSMLCRLAGSGRVGCSGLERQALLVLADICGQTLAALPRRMHADAYRWVMDHPTLTAKDPA
jgi:hypothetical protein